MSCSVVTVLHDSGDVIEACLASVPPWAEVIVVDNASADGGAELAAAARPGAVVIRMRENVGFGAGSNAGARAAGGDAVVFLNPDCTLRDGALEILERCLAERPADVVGPALEGEDGHVHHAVRRRSRPLHETLELLPLVGRLPAGLQRDEPSGAPVYRDGGDAENLQGACLAIARERFLALGGFDEDFFLYSEEESLCERVRADGGRCRYEPRARVMHRWGTSTAKRSAFATRHYYRSRIVFYRKRDGDLRGRLAALAIGAALALNGLVACVPGRRLAAAPARERALAGLPGVLAGATAALRWRSLWPPGGGS